MSESIDKEVFSGLTDDDLQSLYDSWCFLSDERGNLGTSIIRELVYLRGVVADEGLKENTLSIYERY